MNLFSRSNAHMDLTPAERSVLRFLKMLVIAFLLSATPVVYAALATGDVSNTDWNAVINVACATGASAVLSTLWKYLGAVQDVAKGNTVAKSSVAPPEVALPITRVVSISDKPPVAPQNGDVWLDTAGRSLSTSSPDGVGVLPITQFWQTVKGVASLATEAPQEAPSPTSSENVLNQPSPVVPINVTSQQEDGMVAPVPVSSEAGAPTVDSDAPASSPAV